MSVKAYLIKPTSVVIFADRPLNIASDHPNFEKIKEALKNNDFDTAVDLADVGSTITQRSEGKVAIRDGVVFYGDQELHQTFVERILTMFQQGFNVDPLLRFVDKLMDNPSKRAVDSLYDFLEYGNLPITEDGDFIAYKKVRPDYKDIHSGTFDNSVGQVVKVARNQVDEDPEQTCSHGLHVCSHEYLAHFGSSGSRDHVMVVKINPANVVAIPKDYNNTKMRVCEYEVIAEVGHDAVNSVREKAVYKRDAMGRFVA